MKKVSIIVPCFNVESFVEKTLKCLVQQTYKNCEIILVNDGSKDGTLQVLKKYECENIKVFSQENKGLSGARNTGIKNATGDYICFVDSDDFVSNDYVEQLVYNIEKYDADISVCNYKPVKNDKNINFSSSKKYKTKLFFGDDIVKELFRQKTIQLFAWNKLYKKEILNGQLFFEEIRYGEDQSFNYFYLKKCKKLVYFDKKCYFYLQRQGSLVVSPYSDKKYSCFVGLNKMVEDGEIDKRFYDYTKAWKALICLESLYFIYKTKYTNKEIISSIISDLKVNLPYVKKAKKIRWYIKLFAPLGYRLSKLLLGKYLK